MWRPPNSNPSSQPTHPHMQHDIPPHMTSTPLWSYQPSQQINYPRYPLAQPRPHFPPPNTGYPSLLPTGTPPYQHTRGCTLYRPTTPPTVLPSQRTRQVGYLGGHGNQAVHDTNMVHTTHQPLQQTAGPSFQLNYPPIGIPQVSYSGGQAFQDTNILTNPPFQQAVRPFSLPNHPLQWQSQAFPPTAGQYQGLNPSPGQMPYPVPPTSQQDSWGGGFGDAESVTAIPPFHQQSVQSHSHSQEIPRLQLSTPIHEGRSYSESTGNVSSPFSIDSLLSNHSTITGTTDQEFSTELQPTDIPSSPRHHSPSSDHTHLSINTPPPVDKDQLARDLRYAVDNNDFDRVRTLLANGADPNVVYAGEFHLHKACQKGYLPIVKELIDKGADVEKGERWSNLTPLHCACRQGHKDVVMYLVREAKCTVDVRDNVGRTPLHWACGGGHKDVVQCLVEDLKCDVDVRDHFGKTPLHLACEGGHKDVVQYLAEDLKCYVDVRDNVGMTPLHWACGGGHKDVVQCLVEDLKCDVDVRDKYGDTPLHIACKGGHKDIVQYLVKDLKCDVEVKDNEQQLGIIFQELLKIRKTGGGKVLVDIAYDLVGRGYGTEEDKAKLLHEACHWGELDVIKKLVAQHHVDPNVRDSSNQTPLHTACAGNRANKDVVEYLVEKANCDVNVTNRRGRTPRDLARSKSRARISGYLERQQSAQYNTPLTGDEVTALKKLLQEGNIVLPLEDQCTFSDVQKMLGERGHKELATNIRSKVYKEIRQLHSPDWIQVQPKDTACKPGDKAELIIVLKTSTPTCSYQWCFKDEPIPETDSDYEGSTSDQLCLHNCLSKHKGAYKCVITNSSGRSVTSEEATISLNGEPIVDPAVLKLLGGILKAAVEVDFSVYGIEIEELVAGRVELTYDEVELVMKGNSATQSIAENLKEALHSRLEEKRLYQEAMAMGYKISLCYTKILALGPGQVGKSTFLYRLIGLMKGNIQTIQETDPDSLPQCSTGVTELHEAACIRYVSMTGALTDKQWHVFDESTGIQSQLEGLIALLIKQIQEQEQEVVRPKVPAPIEQCAFRDPQENADDIPVYSVAKSDDVDSTESYEVLELEQPETLQNSISETVSYELPEAKSVPQPRKQNINSVILEFEKLQMDSRLSLTQEKTTFHMLFNIADIGGQPAFLEMLPSLTIGPALYLVFMKLLEGLKTRYPTAFKCKDNRGTKLCQNYTYTSEEVIFTALSSIACFGNSDEEVEMYVANQADRKQTNSLALLMGTHADMIKDQAKLSEIDYELKQHIEETEFFTEDLIQFDKFLRVNNYSAPDKEIQEHRQLLEDILTKKFRQFNIPARWLMLSICLKLLAKNEGTHEVSFDDCVEIGKHFEMSREMVKIALQFLHKYIGLVMYFPNHEHLKDIVICDPQAVFTSISELVFKIYDPTNLQVTGAQHDHFVQTGCFSPQDVKPAVAKDRQTQSKVLSIATLIDLLVHLNIVAEVPSCTEEIEKVAETKPPQPSSRVAAHNSAGTVKNLPKRREYIFPAVLQTAEVDTIKGMRQAHEEELPEPICIRFKTGYMPLGFVCALSAKLIGEPKFQLIFKEGSEIITYKNMLKFRYKGKFDVLMISGPKYCEFQVTRHTGKADFWSEDCCPQIKKTICDVADSVVRSMKQGSLYKLSKGYELAFKCTRHQDAEFGHEPLARLVYDPSALGQTLPEEIQCVKATCSTSFPLTPEMRMWFGEAPDFVPLEIICCSRELNRFTVTVEGSDKPYKYQWFKDRKRLTDCASYTGSTTAELVIEGTGSELKGAYKCRVTDTKGVKVWSEEIEVDPFVLLLKNKGLREKEIKKLIDYGYETMEDFEYLKVDDVSLEKIGLIGPEIGRVRKFLTVCERPPLDKDVTDDAGNTPLDLAQIKGHTEVIDYLESRQQSAQQGNTMNKAKDSTSGQQATSESKGYIATPLKVSKDLSYVKPVEVFSVSSSGGVYKDDSLGLSIKIPEGAVPEGSRLHMDVGMCLYGPFKFPPDTTPIAPILMLCPQQDFKLKQPVFITLPHIIDRASADGVDGLGIKVVKAAHEPLFSSHSQQSAVFKDIETPITYSVRGDKEYATFPLSNFSFISLRGNTKQKVALRFGYCIKPMYRQLSSTSELNFVLAITYYMNPWLEAVKEQFMKDGFKVYKMAVQKFTIASEEGTVQGEIVNKEHLQNEWITELQAATREGIRVITAKSVDVWSKELEELEMDISNLLYPPSFCVLAAPKHHGQSQQAVLKFCFKPSDGQDQMICLMLIPNSVLNSSPSSPKDTTNKSISTPDLTSEQPSSPKRPKLDSHVTGFDSEVSCDQVPAPKRPKLDNSRNAVATPGYSNEGNVQTKLPSQDEVLSMHDFSTVHKKLYPACVKWENIGLSLGVSINDLEAMKENFQGNVDKCLKAMLANRLQTGGPLTWRMVCDSLRCGTVARNDVAKDIEQWCTGSTQRPEAEH